MLNKSNDEKEFDLEEKLSSLGYQLEKKFYNIVMYMKKTQNVKLK